MRSAIVGARMTDQAPSKAERADRPTGRLIVLAVWLLCLGGAAFYADGWSTDNRVERWGAQLGEDEGWDILRREFGGDEAVLVRLDQFASDDDTVRKAVTEWTASFESEASVAEVIDAPRIIGAWPWMEGGTEVQRKLALALNLWQEDSPRLDLILRIASDASPAQRAELAANIDASQESARGLGLRLRAAGHPLVSAALDREARRVERTFVPLLVLLAALGAWAFLRSLLLAGLALLPAATASVGARAFARAFIGPSDLILVAVGPIAFVVVLAATLHLVLRFQYHSASQISPAEAARRACRDKAMATSLAAVTTAIGFGVFRVSALQSVVHLGTLVAGTVLVATPVVIFGTSYLLAGVKCTPKGSVSRTGPWRRLAAWCARRRGLIAAAGALVLIGGAWAPSALEAATNGVAYFDEDHPVRQQFEALEAESASLSSAEVLLRRADGEAWQPAALRELDLAEKLNAVTGAEGVIGPELFAKALGPGLGALGVPAVLRRAGRLDEGGETARWTVRFATGESSATGRLLEGLAATAAAAATATAPGARVYVTGSVPRLQAMQDTLVGTLAASLALTILVTTILFVIVTRSLREVIAVLSVNVFPVAFILVVAALAQVPLDGATTMVGAVVLGLAVDNTFHLIHAAGPRPRSDRARLSSFSTVGGAATVGSISLALGFSTLILSGFAPTARFGGLCALGSIAAWAADLVLLPALLPWIGRPKRRI